jgi:hypothetical protein
MKCSEITKSGNPCRARVSPGHTMCNSHRGQANMSTKNGYTQPTRCDGCKFYEEVYDLGKAGMCRFNPPSVGRSDSDLAAWPYVMESDWCGSHKPIKAAK